MVEWGNNAILALRCSNVIMSAMAVANHRHLECLLNRLLRRRSKKISKLRVTGLGGENSPVIGEFPAQMANNVKNVSIWWRHHGFNRAPEK